MIFMDTLNKYLFIVDKIGLFCMIIAVAKSIIFITDPNAKTILVEASKKLSARIEHENNKNKYICLEKVAEIINRSNFMTENFHRYYGLSLTDKKREIIIQNLLLEHKANEKARKTGRRNTLIIDMEKPQEKKPLLLIEYKADKTTGEN